MYRYGAFVLFFAFGIGFQSSHGITVEVKDKENNLCLYANLMVNVAVSYDIGDNKSATVEFEIPNDAKPDGSECGAASSMLKLDFGEGHSWSLNFTMNGNTYQADSITFSYNLNDKTTFPNSVSNDTASVAMNPHITDVAVETCYSCNSKEMIESDSVNQTLWNVLIQAFVVNGTRSESTIVCLADDPITTVAPTTTTAAPTTLAPNTTTAGPTTLAPNTTTAAPTTLAPNTTTLAPNTTTLAPNTTTLAPNTTTLAPNTTTVAPVTNATTTAPPPTTTPTPTLPTPATGKYSIKPDVNGTVCLLASFGLRIGLMQGEKHEEMNFDPNGTTVSGSCGVNSSELILKSTAMTIMLTFTNDTKKFRLHALNVTGKTSSGVVFSEANTNLSLWEAAVGSSYMCNKEQNYTITSLLTFFTFDLQVQPVGVKTGVFSTAEECFLDSDLSFLVPIAVGVALSFLIILVLISYLIGRRKSRTGYQSV